MNDTADGVRAYYAAFGEREWARLENPSDGAVEWAVTCALLDAHLPSAPARVLDLGGGPGRYTVHLAGRGYRVTLADLSPELLDIARTKISDALPDVSQNVAAIVEADACDLSRWPDAAFDAILCLGPFYHLPAAADRNRAARELVRVLRPNGVAFVAFMSRYALVRRTLAVENERRHFADAAWLSRLMETGVFENDVPGKFTNAWGAVPQNIAPFWAQIGMDTLALVSAEGLASGLEAALGEMVQTNLAAYHAAFHVVLQTAGDPALLGMANHLLYVGRKK